ncbi:MAG TPA: hypothetical protein VKQ09_11685 [Sphingomonas sp.]|nr:hypothetical protein [Sphingomonas sp.]
MNDLLAFAIEAHGGIERWNQFSRLRAELSIDGAIWHLKQQPGLFTKSVFDIATHEEQVSISPFLAPHLHTDFIPSRLTLSNDGGAIEKAWDEPETAFVGHEQATPWAPLHAAYFASEALWTYLTKPFLYTYPGFESEEIEPWHENGEEWRRLKVTFPNHIKSHTRTQITHFGPDGLVRRHDYTVDVLGGAPGANYVTEYAEYQGLKFPAKRLVYAYDDKLQKVPDPLLVSIDFHDIKLS